MSNMRSKIKIPIYKPQFGKEEIDAVTKVMESGHLSAGEEVDKFEEEFAEYLGAKFVVAVNSCTSALLLSIRCSVTPEISCPSCTFVSVSNMIIKSGKRIYFTDEIHVGNAYQLRPIPVWDCAHEIYFQKNFESGLFCYSFYPTKLIASCEGGAIATDDEFLYRKLRLLRNHGMERKGFSWDYSVERIGYKMTMNNIQAAIARVQLKKLPELNEQRQKIVDIYNKELELTNTSLHIYPVQVEAERRNEIMQKLEDEGIETSVHFKPIHKQPAYVRMMPNLVLPKSEEWGNTEISLPLWAGMTDKEVKHICKKVRENI